MITNFSLVILLIIPNNILNAVVCISTKREDGKKYILGSGFSYAIFHKRVDENNGLYIHYIVTCKHVIEDCSEIIVSFGNSNEEIELKIQKYRQFAFFDNTPVWFEHESGELDIAVILINPHIIKEKCTNYGYFSSANSLLAPSLCEKKISEGDPVFVMGFPRIFKDNREKDLKVLITRHGSIASINNVRTLKKPEFIVDTLIFPGNSGGPILLDPSLNSDLGYEDKNPLIIGIATDYYSYREKALSDLNYEQKVLFEDNSGLVSVYTLSLVHEIAEYANAKLREYVLSVAKLIKKIDSEEDLEKFFIDSKIEFIKSKIDSNLKGLTSDDAINIILEDVDKSNNLKESIFDHFKAKDFEYGIENLRNLFGYKFIEELIPKEESEKILKLLKKWEKDIKS
jgi:hypothetical protein